MLVNRILLGIIFTLFAGFVFAQKTNDEFSNSWKEIDDLIKQNLTKTALSKIADLAKTVKKKATLLKD